MRKSVLLSAALLVATASGAQALTVNPVDGNADSGAGLVSTLLGGSSGLTVISTGFGGAGVQSGTYSGFNTVGLGALGDGIALSSGHVAKVPLSNTNAAWDHDAIGATQPDSLPNGVSTDADLEAVLAASGATGGNLVVNDVNFLEFSFTVDDPTKNSVSASFVFGTDEFPDQKVTDIFAFFVDGVNYAFFPDNSLINFDLGGPSAGFYQSNIAKVFSIEWDGLTRVLNVTGLLDMSLSEHSIKIAIADTSDRIFDSAVYIASLSAGTTDGGGGIGGPAPIPLPAGFPLLIAALGGLALLRRRPAK